MKSTFKDSMESIWTRLYLKLCIYQERS